MATEGTELTAYPVSYIYDKDGKRLEMADAYARDALASAGKESYPDRKSVV